MSEVQVLEEDLNGLGYTIKQIIDNNITKPSIWNSVKNIKGSLVITEKSSQVAVTLFFEKGVLKIHNNAISSASAYLEAGFDELAEISSGQVGPITALLKSKIKARGNLFKLLMMSKALISIEDD